MKIKKFAIVFCVLIKSCRDVACHVFTICHPEELATKDLGCIAQPEVDVTEILHFVQDDIRKRDAACHID